MMRTPWEIAEAWYDEASITNQIEGGCRDIPVDVRSQEFAKWITHEYRIAMAKGIQLGRDGTED